jgi:hypothetical protein
MTAPGKPLGEPLPLDDGTYTLHRSPLSGTNPEPRLYEVWFCPLPAAELDERGAPVSKPCAMGDLKIDGTLRPEVKPWIDRVVTTEHESRYGWHWVYENDDEPARIELKST